jgi:hypothetical protein
VELGVALTGNYNNSGYTGTFTEGSFTITAVPPVPGILVGDQLTNLFGSAGPQPLPSGTNTVVSVTSTTVTFTNTPGGPDQGVPVPALASGTTIPFTVLDQWPLGSCQVTVTPSTGVTVTDTNADGTGNVGHTGSGTFIVNLSNQAEGNFAVMFATAGTFSISAAYVPADANYLTATVAVPFTVVVT